MTAGGSAGGRRWMVLYTLAWLAIWTVQLTPIQLLLPLQLDTQDSEGEWIHGVVWSGLILSVGGVAGIVVGPIAGRLSDRTRSPWGRRRPWAVGGSVVAAISLVLTGLAAGPWAIGAAWVGVWIGLATLSAALTAMIADQLTERRGAASAAISSSQAVGVVVGVAAVVLLGLGVVESYLVLAAFIAIVGVVTAVLLPDPLPEDGASDTAAPARGWLTGALRAPGFAWMLASRLLVNIGNALVTALLLFFLMYGIGSETAEDDLLVLILIYTVFVVAASVLAGMISDRTGSRRGLVIASALVQAVSVVAILIAPSFATTAIAAALMGVGYGANMAVGLALATDLLPDAGDNGRDLGLVNVAANLGQLIGPLLGAGLVAAVGGFWLLIVASAVTSLLGAALMLPVREASRRPDPAVR